MVFFTGFVLTHRINFKRDSWLISLVAYGKKALTTVGDTPEPQDCLSETKPIGSICYFLNIHQLVHSRRGPRTNSTRALLAAYLPSCVQEQIKFQAVHSSWYIHLPQLISR